MKPNRCCSNCTFLFSWYVGWGLGEKQHLHRYLAETAKSIMTNPKAPDMALLFTIFTFLCQTLSLQHQARSLLYQIRHQTFLQSMKEPSYHERSPLCRDYFCLPDEKWEQYLHISLDLLIPLLFRPHWNEWVDFFLFSQSFISCCWALIMEISDINDPSSSCCQCSNLKTLMGCD